MATLAEDADSWKAHSVIRRDYRHTAVDDEHTAHRKSARKNTKKWCLGREGRLHEPVSGDYWGIPIATCKTCGKELAYGKSATALISAIAVD